ncbi:TPA: NUDIX hydrolase [Candidatus Micrarchaeota archaeon]|nr:NUDIX hydrolase [Candidatus Micrarchaeota archaeon]
MVWRLRVEAQAVSFTLDRDRLLFLLVKKANGWRIPKGGVEKGEDFPETIVRELWEEVGIEEDRIVIIKKFNEYMYEDPKAEILHNPHVYLVYIRGRPEPKPDYEEISAAKWVDFQTAQRMLRFREEKNTLKMAYDIISKLSPSYLRGLEAGER